MHELALAANILDIVLEAATAQQAVKVTSVKLTVGELTGVSPDALQFCFQSVADGTIAAGADLAIEVMPLTGYCRLCNRQFAIQQYRFYCPDCGEPAADVVAGRELRVDQIEVD